MITPYRKKLIEVALPLEAINKEAAREKSIRHGHPSTLHLWWARRPLAACRAVLFASLVDDPSAWPERFPTEEAQGTERLRIFAIIEELVKWENSNNERVLNAAKAEIARSLAWTRGETAPSEPDEVQAYLAKHAPPVYDPFCGGGSIPLEAQRLGLEAHASDLNPVAVLITKALIEIPPEFAGRPPVNPESLEKLSSSGSWQGAAGLAEDIRYYGKWMRAEAEKRMGHFYPKVKINAEMAKGRPDLKAHVAKELTVIAWLWARTVASPNPAAKGAHVPLVRSFVLSTKNGKRAWVEPVVDEQTMTYRFDVRCGKGNPRAGTIGRNGAQCLLTGSPMPLDYVRAEAKAGRMSVRLLAIVADGKGRVYVPATEEHERIATSLNPPEVSDTELPTQALGFRVQIYGMTKHRLLFSARQLFTLDALCSLVIDASKSITAAAVAAGLSNEDAKIYGRSVATYLALGVSKLADYNSTLVLWSQTRDQAKGTFTRHALPMVWDFAEVNMFAGAAGDLRVSVDGICDAIERLPSAGIKGHVKQVSATTVTGIPNCIFSTDPPYYNNIGYADLSDFFYVWLRKALSKVDAEAVSTMLVPKTEELIASPFRFGGNSEMAKTFFEAGLGKVFESMRPLQNIQFPLTLFYAFKQSEDETEESSEQEHSSSQTTNSRSSTGWETMLQSLIEARFQIAGTWPLRTERGVRSIALGTNALASSIVLVCRPRPEDALSASRREFLTALKRELPTALRHLQRGNIAPVDLAQAAIGPGMAVFSRYAKVLETDGSTMSVRAALALINQSLDEVLAEQEGEFDADTRWAVAWFDQHGFENGAYGTAETLCTAKNTSVSGMTEAGIVAARAGKVRLLRKEELEADWDPATDRRFTIWEATHHLVRALEERGEEGSADLISRLGGERAERARDLSYRLYTICERRKWAKDALPYNALVQAWPEASRLSASKPVEGTLRQREML